MWDGVEERLKKKLALWKRQYISKGGRLTLIKSTLSNLPIYTMSLYKPTGIKSRLEKNPEGFSLGWGKPRQKDSLSELRYGLQKQRRWWARRKKTGKCEQITTL